MAGRLRQIAELMAARNIRIALETGQEDADGEADTSYRYVLMPVRFAS